MSSIAVNTIPTVMRTTVEIIIVESPTPKVRNTIIPTAVKTTVDVRMFNGPTPKARKIIIMVTVIRTTVRVQVTAVKTTVRIGSPTPRTENRDPTARTPKLAPVKKNTA